MGKILKTIGFYDYYYDGERLFAKEDTQKKFMGYIELEDEVYVWDGEICQFFKGIQVDEYNESVKKFILGYFSYEDENIIIKFHKISKEFDDNGAEIKYKVQKNKDGLKGEYIGFWNNYRPARLIIENAIMDLSIQKFLKEGYEKINEKNTNLVHYLTHYYNLQKSKSEIKKQESEQHNFFE